MEIIRIAGYTEDEKVEIACKHLIPNALTKHGVNAKEWAIEEDALIPVSRMDEVLGHSLVRKPEPIAWGQGSTKPAERPVEAGFSTLTSH